VQTRLEFLTGPNYSVKWTAATSRGNLTLTVAAATYLKR